MDADPPLLCLAEPDTRPARKCPNVEHRDANQELPPDEVQDQPATAEEGAPPETGDDDVVGRLNQLKEFLGSNEMTGGTMWWGIGLGGVILT